MTNGGVLGGLEERKIELGYLRIRREVLTTPSSLYNSSLVIIKREEIMTKKKTQEMKSKVKTNHFLLVIRFPPQSTIPQSSLLPLISIQHSHEAIRLQRLK